MSFLQTLGQKVGFGSQQGNQQQQPQGTVGPQATMRFQTQGNQQPQGGNNGGNIGPDGNPIDNGGGNGGQSSGQQQPADPLDRFKGMWDNPKDPEAAPGFSLDPEKMKGLRGQQNFMNGIDPALMEKAQGGDFQSMMQVMHELARNSYASSLDHGSKLTESFVSAREGFGKKNFGKDVRAELTNQELSNMEGVQSPVMKQHLQKMGQQLRQMYPDASPQEIARMTRELVTEMAAPFQQKQNPQQGGQPKQFDWGTQGDAWFDGTDSPNR